MIEPIVDISHWQGDIDAQKMIDAGTIGMYIRAGSIDGSTGVCYTDYRFIENVGKFANAVPCGYYWYFRPEYSGIQQAEYLVRLLSGLPRNLPPVIDIESNNQNVSQGTYQARIKEFLDAVRIGLRVDCAIYTRSYFWNANVGDPEWASKYKLWIAMYNNFVEHPWEFQGASMGYKPFPWDNYWMWQWSADGNIRGEEFGTKSDSIDLNRCSMDLDEFYKFANWGEPEPEPKTVRVDREVGVVYNEIDDYEFAQLLMHNTVLEVIEQQNDWYKVRPPEGWIHKDYVE